MSLPRAFDAKITANESTSRYTDMETFPTIYYETPTPAPSYVPLCRLRSTRINLMTPAQGRLGRSNRVTLGTIPVPPLVSRYYAS